jgi:hypothetical protein
MTHPTALRVHPLSEVRERLSGILARFRSEGTRAEPVIFGTHRKPEAIILPYSEYEAFIEQRQRLLDVMDSLRSVQVEIPGPYSLVHDQAVAAYVTGEIDEDQAYRRVLDHYQQHP